MKKAFYISMLLPGLLFMACKRLPLHDESGRIRLELDIDLEIKHQPDTPMPGTMLVLYYDPLTERYITRDYVESDGGEIQIDAGKYKILIYNFDTETTHVRNLNDFRTVEAYTNEASSDVSQTYRAMMTRFQEVARTGMETVINEPDHLFVGQITEADIPVRVEGEEIITLQVDASTILDSYYIEIGPITGIEHIQSAEVFVIGQKASKFLTTDSLVSNPVTIYFPIAVDGGKKAFATSFNTFGKYPGAENKVYLNVLITDTEGGQYQYQYDVTDQFDDPENEELEIIVGDSIDVPEPSKGGGGFIPEVNGWEGNEYDIIL